MNGGMRAIGSIVVVCGLYSAFVIESAIPSQSTMPHLPLAFAVWGVFSLPASGAVFAAALIGLGCDALSAGPLGPGMLAATLMCFAIKQFEMRREFMSIIAIGVVTAVVVAATLGIAAAISESVLRARIDLRMTALVAGSRGVTTAGLAIALALVLRSVRVAQRVATAI
jgi:rod shape-determining protein MreD